MEVSATRQLLTLMAACTDSEPKLVETALAQLQKSVEQQIVRRVDAYQFPARTQEIKTQLKSFTYKTDSLQKLYRSHEKLRMLIQAADVPFLEHSIGKIVRFGSYQAEPILWQVVNVGEAGELLLVSARILTCKAFAAINDEPYGQASAADRFGSNRWESSTLRAWLNAEQRKVVYEKQTPDKEHVWNGYNDYVKEMGFLAEGNFTAEERRLLQPRRHQIATPSPGESIADDETDTIQDVIDLVTLLHVEEWKAYMAGRGWDLVAQPTERAVSQSDLRSSHLCAERNWQYLLVEPSPETGHLVQMVTAKGELSDGYAYDGTIGVRPVICLRTDIRMLGAGTWNDPYVPSLQEGERR